MTKIMQHLIQLITVIISLTVAQNNCKDFFSVVSLILFLFTFFRRKREMPLRTAIVQPLSDMIYPLTSPWWGPPGQRFRPPWCRWGRWRADWPGCYPGRLHQTHAHGWHPHLAPHWFWKDWKQRKRIYPLVREQRILQSNLIWPSKVQPFG